MPDPRYLQPKKGMTSLEAAALYLSDGQTKDPALAVASQGNPFNLDDLQRSHLRRMMGFDWSVTVNGKKLTAYSTEYPYVSETVKFNGLIDEKAVDKLVDVCVKLKETYEAEQAKLVEEDNGTDN